MKWIEKIKAMDADEMAEFIYGDGCERLRDKICEHCSCYREKDDSICTSNGDEKDCIAAMKKTLESEIDDGKS